MSLSGRDRKIVLAVVPLLVLAAYWFLLLAPKREEAKMASAEASEQQQRVTDARSKLAAADAAKTGFATDFTEIVRLGKAIPTTVDMPSLIVQLDGAAAGTGIHFTRIAAGDRETAIPAAPAAGAAPSSADGAAPVEAGGEAAQSAPGSATEAANSADQSGVSPAETQTSTSGKTGGLPVGGGSTTSSGPAAGGGATPAGLDTVSLELEFVGDFFNLADFFHDVKRFVRVAGQDVVVGGRLITIDDVTFSSDTELFPSLKAELKATIYLSPQAEGTAAGATPQGPAPTTGSTPASTPADSVPAPTATTIP